MAYLIILHENRHRAKKVNYKTQCFYSNGIRFSFLYIIKEGVVRHFHIFDISKKEKLKVIFSYIVNMIEIVMKMTSTVTLTKLGSWQDLEFENYHNEVLIKIYKWEHKSIVVFSNSTENNFIDIKHCISSNSIEDDFINIS